MKKIYSILSALIIAVCLIGCQNDEIANQVGYLSLDVKTLVTANTRATDAPADYAPKQIYVEILNSSNDVVKSTSDFQNDAEWNGANIKLEPGTYTINAHSNNWDGSQSGFDTPYYFGSTKVTVEAKTRKSADITCTLANVKVTVNFDQSFLDNFKSAVASISSSATGVSPLSFTMGQTTASGYFPVGDLTSVIAVVNMYDEQHSQSDVISDVKARDHYIFNYKVADYGSIGGISVSVDESTKTYTYTWEIARKASIALETYTPVVDETSATLKGKVASKDNTYDAKNLSLQWKAKDAADWTTLASDMLTIDTDDNISYELTGLTTGASYVFRLTYQNGDDLIKSSEKEFVPQKGEPKEQIYNGGFENWYTANKAFYVNESGVNYWDSSNPGSASYGINVTTQETEMVHSGSSSAKLGCRYVVIKFAAASMYTGKFNDLIGTSGAMLDWGVPFTSRPSALKGYLSYTPGSINRGTKPSGVGAPDKNSGDLCQIFCALLTEQLHVGGNAEKTVDGIHYEKSTLIDWQNDPRIIAYGELTYGNNDNGQWKEFNIPLIYHDANAIPTHMLIVCSASKYGDYFYGSDKTVLYLDDFEFEYGERTVK